MGHAGFGTAGFDHIRIDRALGQKGRIGEFAGLAINAAPGVTIMRTELEAQQPPIIRKILRRVENLI